VTADQDSQTPENESGQDDSTDLRLATQVEKLQLLLRQGDVDAVEKLCTEDPDLESELRGLWAMMVAVSITGSQFRLDGSKDKHNALFPAMGADTQHVKLPITRGDFELISELGRGGMGIVYRAHQISLDRDVALKMILPGYLHDAEHLERFQQEAEAAAQLDHPGIVSVFEVGHFEDQPFLCMKLIEGQTISQLGAEQAFPSRQAAGLILQVSQAIQYAHRRGVLHRDLKPSNILVDRDDQTHVTDFGLAKRFTQNQEITHTGAVLGTPSYMAPEQAAGGRGEAGVHSDVYALGAVLYFMVTGRPPFQAAHAIDTVLLVLQQEPTPPRALNPMVDRDLEMIILKCLQKPADLRYPSAQQLADDLEAYLNYEPVQASKGRFGSILARWFSETQHASVLQKWGLLWMWHSIVLLIVCIGTDVMLLQEFENRLIYSLTWTLGLGTWAVVFWTLRRKRGAVLFVERQIAHAWGASIVAIGLLFPIESLLKLEPLQAAPVMGLISGMVFIVKAGILTGKFYLQAILLFLTALLMAVIPKYSLTLFGAVSALCFFIPGWYYHHRGQV